MRSIGEEKLDLSQRRILINLERLFPQLNRSAVLHRFESFLDENPHQTVLDVAVDLWNGSYDWLLETQGFYDSKYEKFSGHCHQCTPTLGLVLKILGFDQVNYLECYRIHKNFGINGMAQIVLPEEEPNTDARDEFCSIGRIPYCCLEVKIGDESFYLTGKHIKSVDGTPKALLTPVCYRDFIGVFSHQNNKTKSGIYLALAEPNKSGAVVWTKQTEKDLQPELFYTYLTMELA